MESIEDRSPAKEDYVGADSLVDYPFYPTAKDGNPYRQIQGKFKANPYEVFRHTLISRGHQRTMSLLTIMSPHLCHFVCP